MYASLLKETWNQVYDPEADVAMVVQRCFHMDFKQCINGEKMNREMFIAHVIEQKKNMTIHAFEYHKILEKNNELFALYYPIGINRRKETIKGEVVAYFEFEQQQIICIHGQVRFIVGP